MAHSVARDDKDGLIERLLQNLREVTGFLQHDELSEDGTLAWRAALGALSVCCIDKVCRRRLLDADPALSVLLALAEALATAEGDHSSLMLRVTEVFASVLVRDAQARQGPAGLGRLYLDLSNALGGLA
jgi:hypothetical protein